MLSSIKPWCSSMSFSFFGISLPPKKIIFVLTAPVHYTINSNAGVLNLLLQNNTMVTAKPQSRMKANVTVMIILNKILKKNQNKLSWFPCVHFSVEKNPQNYVIKHYFVSFPNSGLPKSKSVEMFVCLTSS